MLEKIVQDLQKCQRQRAVALKSRNMLTTRIQAVVAGTLGYSADLPQAERLKKFQEAANLIEEIKAGEAQDFPMLHVVNAHNLAIDELNQAKKNFEKAMIKLANDLPVADWVRQPEQRGFGILFLAIVVGEAGDLSKTGNPGYSNPGKLWKRFGCAPWTFNGATRMGASWRPRQGAADKLPREEWSKFGYSPRRRSIAYLIGEGLVKQNGGEAGDEDTPARPCGPYRARYEQVKAQAMSLHPEWLHCEKCQGKGKTARQTACPNCKGTGKTSLRCHRHAMLLATKLLLKNLWIAWNPAAYEAWGREAA